MTSAAWPFNGRRGNAQLELTNSTAETTLIPAYQDESGNAIFADIYCLIIGNKSGTNTSVSINDKTSGTKRFDIPVPAHDTKIITLPKEDAHKQSVAGQNWTAQCADQVTSIEITVLFLRNS